MTKKDLLEMLSEFPDDTDLVFTQETEEEAGDVSDMYLSCVTKSEKFNYANLYFRWTDTGE